MSLQTDFVMRDTIVLRNKGDVLCLYSMWRHLVHPPCDGITMIICFHVYRADRLSVDSGSGEFVVIIDLEGFSLSTVPPLNQIKNAANLLKRHYPYRLGGELLLMDMDCLSAHRRICSTAN
jgi:hypothetical protein